jgi:S-adenosylmethionine-diacylgycerolhomoserine-N-methlytransferase
MRYGFPTDIFRFRHHAGLVVTPLSREHRKELVHAIRGALMSAFHSGFGANTSWPIEATHRMNRMYRRQRYIYDGTRRYYLLGRDQLIAGLRPAAGESVLEIGCGTGRNLVLAARQYPGARFFGVDVSTEMLTSAISAISRGGLTGQIRVAHGDATAFDPRRLFGVPSFDHVMISYSLSMIPGWHRVLMPR